jgi:hypothetical protein
MAPEARNVWEFVDRTVQRRTPGVFCVQLNEVDFLLGFPVGAPAAAAANSIDILHDVFQHFLGRSDQVRQWVRAIPSIEAGLSGMDQAESDPAEPADLSAPRTAEPSTAPAGSALTLAPDHGQTPAPPTTPVAVANNDHVIGWTSISGETQNVAMQLRPVWSLQHGAVSSFRLYRGFNPISLGYGQDRERLDLAVLDYATGPDALGFLQQGTYLHLPVALTTLLLQRTRMRYLAKLKTARHLFRQRVLLELEGVDRGVVESRLQEVVHIMRPFFRLILASTTGGPVRGPTLRSAGVSGAIIDLAAIDEPMTRTDLLARVNQARKDLPIVLVHGLFEGEVDDESLRAAGASHASSRPGDRIGPADQPAISDQAQAEAAELRRVAGLIRPENRS